jgi:hypothetical protein
MLWSLVLWSSDRGVLISRRWFTRRYQESGMKPR